MRMFTGIFGGYKVVGLQERREDGWRIRTWHEGKNVPEHGYWVKDGQFYAIDMPLHSFDQQRTMVGENVGGSVPLAEREAVLHLIAKWDAELDQPCPRYSKGQEAVSGGSVYAKNCLRGCHLVWQQPILATASWPLRDSVFGVDHEAKSFPSGGAYFMNTCQIAFSPAIAFPLAVSALLDWTEDSPAQSSAARISSLLTRDAFGIAASWRAVPTAAASPVSRRSRRQILRN